MAWSDADTERLRKLPLAIDRSGDRTPAAWFAARGVVGMAMYLSWTAWKNWTRELVEEAWAAGLWVLLNWEAMGDWSEFAAGAAGGKAAGLHAGSLCAGLRAPSWVPIVVSADYPAPPEHWDTIAEWLNAFRAASGHPVGVYGGAEFGEAMLDRGAVVFWQANASSWSADERISPRASMVQFVGDGGLGVSVDENRVIDATPFAWRGDDQKPPTTPSAPSPPQEDDMPSISLQPGESAGIVIPAAYRRPRLRVSMNSAAKTHGAKARVVIFGPDNKPRPSAAHAPKDPWHVWIPNGSRVLDQLTDGDLSIDVALDKGAGGSLAVLVEDA